MITDFQVQVDDDRKIRTRKEYFLLKYQIERRINEVRKSLSPFISKDVINNIIVPYSFDNRLVNYNRNRLIFEIETLKEKCDKVLPERSSFDTYFVDFYFLGSFPFNHIYPYDKISDRFLPK
jgi:hypothetical protein